MDTYELTEGEHLPVVAEYVQHDYTAWVLYRVEAAHEWLVTWTDGINQWCEEYDYPWHAFARLAALVAACDQQVFLVHDPSNRGPAEGEAFREEADRFVARTVHAYNCASTCYGDGPKHQV
jgi:hypothetical protein